MHACASGCLKLKHTFSSPAFLAQLKKDDEILLVDGTETFTWQQVNMKMLSRLGETGEIKLTIARPGIDENLNIVLPINEWMANNIEPDPLTDLGIVSVQIPPIIGGVIEGGAADIGGLRAGDIVLRVNDIYIERSARTRLKNLDLRTWFQG